jgi:hypothetical protein
MSEAVFSGNLNDISRVKRKIEQVAKIDRLPGNNCLEGLMILQQAWDHVDIFTQAARHNKHVSKASFMILLLLGLSVIVVTVISSNWHDCDQHLQQLVAFEHVSCADLSRATVLVLALVSR